MTAEKIKLEITIAFQDYNRLVEILDSNDFSYWLAASSNTGDGLESIKFGMFLTGHGESDINQMYNDWKNSQQ